MEKPILMNASMVRAILSGEKTQTRRVIKPQPTESGLEWVTACDGDFYAWQDPGLNLDEHSEEGGPCQRLCPYGQPGDTLWVRETWQMFCGANFYRADSPDMIGWVPSIHMPRWASRITLEIINVRAERLQEITEYDAIAEGCRHHESHIMSMATGYIATFREPWDSIYGKKYPWGLNPWVWVIKFKRVI